MPHRPTRFAQNIHDAMATSVDSESTTMSSFPRITRLRHPWNYFFMGLRLSSICLILFTTRYFKLLMSLVFSNQIPSPRAPQSGSFVNLPDGMQRCKSILCLEDTYFHRYLIDYFRHYDGSRRIPWQQGFDTRQSSISTTQEATCRNSEDHLWTWAARSYFSFIIFCKFSSVTISTYSTLGLFNVFHIISSIMSS